MVGASNVRLKGSHLLALTLLLLLAGVECNPGPVERSPTHRAEGDEEAKMASENAVTWFKTEGVNLFGEMLAKALAPIQQNWAKLEDKTQELTQELTAVKRENAELKLRLVALESRTERLEIDARKYNLLLYTIPQTSDETAGSLKAKVEEFLAGLGEGDIEIRDIKRLKMASGSPPFPVILTLARWEDRVRLLKLNAEQKKIGEAAVCRVDFPQSVRAARAILRPYLNRAIDLNFKVRFRDTKLRVKDKWYTSDERDELEKVLREGERNKEGTANEKTQNEVLAEGQDNGQTGRQLRPRKGSQSKKS